MSPEISTRVSQYVDYLDEIAPPITVEELEGMVGRVPLRSVPRRPARDRIAVPGWAWALVAFAVTIIIVVVGLVLFSPADDGPDVIQPAPPSLIGPGAWDLAVTLPPALFLADNAPYESMGDIVAALESIDGVAEVAMIRALRDDWTGLIGAEGADIGCSPQCEQGVVVVAETIEDLEKTARVFFGWEWKVPSSEINFSSSASTGLAEIGTARIQHLTSYLDSVSGQTGPEPKFDTDTLGTEQVLVAVDASEVPPGPPEEPFRPQSLAVKIAGTEIGAFLGYPEPATLQSTDAVEYDIAPSGSNPQDLRLALQAFCGCEGGELDGERVEYSASGTSIPLGLDLSLDPAAGLMGYQLDAGIQWEGRAGFGIGGLPITVAVVATELPDGTRLWQRPVSGIAFFTAADSFEGFPEVEPDTPSLVFYGAAGNQIFVQQ